MQRQSAAQTRSLTTWVVCQHSLAIPEIPFNRAFSVIDIASLHFKGKHRQEGLQYGSTDSILQPTIGVVI